MTLIEQNLRSDILRGSTYSISSFSDHFGETKINQLQVPIAPNHNVFWFQITVADLFSLKVFENRDNLRPVESSLLWIKVSNAPMVSEEVATFQQFCHEVDVPVVLHEAIIFHLKSISNTNNLQ